MDKSTTNLIVGFLNDFLVVAGGIVSGAMLATKEVSIPSAPVMILALIIGLTQAARRAQSKMDPSVTSEPAMSPAAVAEIVKRVANPEAQTVQTPKLEKDSS